MTAGLAVALPDEAATRALGAALATALAPGDVIHLVGELGAGKTTLARGLVQALVPGARVRSPTYTLVEPYSTPAFDVLHLDLYRLAAPDELEALGIRERVGEAVIVAEWPERAAGALPEADLRIELRHASNGREARLLARGPRAAALLHALAGSVPQA
jgi:tRNA threonylcarbamoyladenosine biosynthesis protein TsaE